MKLLLVRHGDPDYSIDSLTETGWKEAELLSNRLSALPVKAFYCSPMGRAQDTFRATGKKTGRTPEILPWLREFGPVIHKPTPSAADNAWDWLPQEWTAEPRFYDKDHWFEVPIFAEADMKTYLDEVHTGLDAVLARHGYVREGNLYRAEAPNEDTIVFVCHFGLTCVVLSHLLGLSPMVLWHGSCAAPTSVTTLATEERREGVASFRMLSFGDISHLYAAGEQPSFAARFCETFRNSEQRHD